MATARDDCPAIANMSYGRAGRENESERLENSLKERPIRPGSRGSRVRLYCPALWVKNDLDMAEIYHLAKGDLAKRDANEDGPTAFLFPQAKA